MDENSEKKEGVKYVVTGTPHLRAGDSTQDIMLDVIVALCPALVMATYYFGVKALSLVAVSVGASVLFELLWCLVMKKKPTVYDLSAVVTGILLAYNLPANAPVWIPIVGAFFAVVIVKQLFGGIGMNFVNPALAARAFLMASYPSLIAPAEWPLPLVTDGTTGATPLALLARGELAPRVSDVLNALVGNTGGSLGETCAIALLVGGIYLLARRVISWRIPVVYILTFAVMTLIFGRNGDRSLNTVLFEVLSGGLILGAVFMATDYTTSPVTNRGKIIFAVGCGVLNYLIRVKGSGYPEGTSYSILLMNLAVPLIERFTRPRVFGAGRKKKEAAENA